MRKVFLAVHYACWVVGFCLLSYMGFTYLSDELTAGAFVKREWKLYVALFSLMIVIAVTQHYAVKRSDD